MERSIEVRVKEIGVKLEREQDPKKQAELIRTLGQLGHSSASKYLTAFKNHENHEIQTAVKEALIAIALSGKGMV